MKGLLKRNLKIFFRDKSAVFFSLLGVIILIVLYAFFLHDSYSSSAAIGEGADFLFDTWMMGGLIVSASVTSCLGGYGIMIADEYNKNGKDFKASPLKSISITSSYIINGFIISLVMTFFALLFSEIYIVINGGSWMSLLEMIKVLFIIVLTCLSSNAVICFIASFLHSSQAYTSCSVVTGTLIGFLVGAYVPIGRLPGIVRDILSILPCTHSAALLRQIMTSQACDISLGEMSHADVRAFKSQLGITLEINQYQFSVNDHITIIVISILLFYFLSILRMKKLRRQ